MSDEFPPKSPMAYDEMLRWQMGWYNFIIDGYAKHVLRLDEDYWEVVVCRDEELVWVYGKGPDAFTLQHEPCETKSQDRNSSTNVFVKEGGSGKTYGSIQIVFAKDFGTLPQCKYVYVIIWVSAEQYNLYRVSAEEALQKLEVKKREGSDKTSHHFSINEIKEFESYELRRKLMPEDDYEQYVHRWGEAEAKKKIKSEIIKLKFSNPISSMEMDDLKLASQDLNLPDEDSIVKLKQGINEHYLQKSVDELIQIVRELK